MANVFTTLDEKTLDLQEEVFNDYIDLYSKFMRSKLTRQEHLTFNTKVDSMVDCGPEHFTIGLDAHYSNMCTYSIRTKSALSHNGINVVEYSSSIEPFTRFNDDYDAVFPLRARDGFLLNSTYTADRSLVSPEAATMKGYKSLSGSISLT